MSCWCGSQSTDLQQGLLLSTPELAAVTSKLQTLLVMQLTAAVTTGGWAAAGLAACVAAGSRPAAAAAVQQWCCCKAASVIVSDRDWWTKLAGMILCKLAIVVHVICLNGY